LNFFAAISLRLVKEGQKRASTPGGTAQNGGSGAGTMTADNIVELARGPVELLAAAKTAPGDHHAGT